MSGSSPSNASAETAGASPVSPWITLIALCTAFALSQAFRTVAAILANPLQNDLGLTGEQLGVFAGAFHFAFGAMQLFMGAGIDVYGVRRTVLAAFPLAVVGAVVSAMAPNYPVLVAGQMLIGVGCAPAFLVCTVFIARSFGPERFAPVSGIVMALGGLGMLFTGTPLAWLVQHSSWRVGFWVLAGASVASWFAMLLLAGRDASPAAARRGSVLGALRDAAALFALPHTVGIVVLGAMTYASFITLRGLWLGPMLIEREAFSLVQSGHVALLVSVVSLFGPPLFGRYDPGAGTRRRWIVAFACLMAAFFVVLALGGSAWLSVGTPILIGLLSGFIILQYADVRAAYPAGLTGRAMAVFTMAMFLGIALMQWLTGLVAAVAAAHGYDAFSAVFAAIAFMLVVGAGAFAVLPAPRPPRP